MSTPTSVNSTHSNPLTPVCLERRGRVPTMRLTIDSPNDVHYSQAEANPHDEVVDALQAEENRVPYIPPRQKNVRELQREIKQLKKRIKFLEEFLVDTLAHP